MGAPFGDPAPKVRQAELVPVGTVETCRTIQPSLAGLFSFALDTQESLDTQD